MRKILIAGANSYIGDSVKEYLKNDAGCYQIDVIDTFGLEVTPQLFMSYDVVFSVAGIAHIKETNKNRNLYYEVNRDLIIKIAEAAKEAGVKQFILLSTMSVYGTLTGHITKETKEEPRSAYGISKFQADKVIISLSDDRFKVAILRPPMVYGKGCKGNYQMLRSFALKSPVFPNIENQRSMLYIGNLCEFVKKIIDEECFGIFFPQNKEYVCTSEMVELIAKNNEKRINKVRCFNFILCKLNYNIIKKVFGNLTYEQKDIVDKYGFEESIILSEMR